jgi:hypothetical protein
VRRLFAFPSDPTLALRIAAGVLILTCAVFAIRALPDVRDFIRVPGSSAGFVFGLANGVAGLALLKRFEWARRLALVLATLWACVVPFGLVFSAIGSLFWSHASLAPVLAWAISVTLVYAWMFGTLMRTDVQCVTG